MREFLAVAVVLFFIFLQWSCSSPRPRVDSPTEFFRCYYELQMSRLRYPDLHAEFLQFKEKDQSRLDVYYEIPYSNLHFRRNGENVFFSDISIIIVIDGVGNSYSDRKSFSRRIVVTSEEISRYGAGERGIRSFRLGPGDYVATVTLIDRALDNRRQVREEISVRGFEEDTLTVSDILLVRSLRELEGRRVITPMLSSRVLALTEPFHLFVEMYSAGEATEAGIFYGLVRKHYNNDFVSDSPFSYRVQRHYHRTGIRVESRDTVFASDTTVSLASGKTPVFLALPDDIEPGSYDLFVMAGGKGQGEDKIIIRQTSFMLHAMDFPYVTGVDQQIDVLEHIITYAELEYMRRGETVEERQRRLDAFWQRVGAWKMGDYYERVRLANELFTTNVEGWKTPMGMIYIILGEPNLVECRISVERSETWTYFLSGDGMEITFVRERTADRRDPEAFYWIFTVRGRYSTWMNAVNFWR